jgi:hypothetical protein
MLTEQQVLAAYDISATNLRHHATTGNVAHITTHKGTRYREADVAATVALLAQQRARRSARYIAENPIPSNLNERTIHEHDHQ